MPYLKIRAYLEKQKAEREEKLSEYNALIAEREQINHKIDACGDVSPLIAEVNEIDSLISELEPTQEVNDSSKETTSNLDADGIDIESIINTEV